MPSEFVRRMYTDSGIDGERVRVVPNGVDLDRFTPDGPRLDIDAPGVRLLFVGGLIRRKGAGRAARGLSRGVRRAATT